MTYPQILLPTLEALYRLGNNICAEIEKFQPNVVLGLAHSGWMPVVVAKTLWTETRTEPFPSSTRTNIGLEKNEIYVARYGKDIPAFCCGECSDEAGRKGHYLAWLSEQSAWLETLRNQIQAVYPATPARILVVDDIFGGWRSGYAALALLETLYPNVETYVYAGHDDLTDDFVIGWLEQFVPVLAHEIESDHKNTSARIRYRSPWQEKLKPLINSTEDIAPDRLDWQFLGPESPAVKALEEYVPAEIVLSAPAWVKGLACAYAMQRLHGEIKDAEVVEPQEDLSLWMITHLSLYPEDCLAARAWKNNGVTHADIAQIYGDSPEKMQAGLKAVSVQHEWRSHALENELRYYPTTALDSWINAYRLPGAPEVFAPKIPVKGFAEFIPNEVWAGAYPIPIDIRVNANLFRDLLGLGITRFIDLTNPNDLQRNFSYHNFLLETGQGLDRQIKIDIFPLPFRTGPTHQQIQELLEHITRVIKNGERIYIHAGHNLEGRTPLILACLLIQRGYSTELALMEVNAFWSKTLHFLIRSPLSAAQQNFILN